MRSYLQKGSCSSTMIFFYFFFTFIKYCEQYSVTYYSFAVPQGRAPPFFIFVFTIILPTPRKDLKEKTLSQPNVRRTVINQAWSNQTFEGTFELMIEMAIGTLSLRMLPARFRWWCQPHFQGKSFLCQSHPGTGIVVDVWSDDLCSFVDRLLVSPHFVAR